MTRDVRIIHRRLQAQGRAVWLGEPFPKGPPLTPLDDVPRAVAGVKALFEESIGAHHRAACAAPGTASTRRPKPLPSRAREMAPRRIAALPRSSELLRSELGSLSVTTIARAIAPIGCCSSGRSTGTDNRRDHLTGAPKLVVRSRGRDARPRSLSPGCWQAAVLLPARSQAAGQRRSRSVAVLLARTAGGGGLLPGPALMQSGSPTTGSWPSPAR